MVMMSSKGDGMNEILPNLYRIKVPLPQNPLGFINSYVIKGKERSLIIDTGMNRKECKSVMFDGLNKLDIDLDKADVFITHFHEDHIGLVPYLITDTLTVQLSKVEADMIAQYLSQESVSPWWVRHSDFIRMRGFPEDELKNIAQSHPDSGYEIRGRLNLRTLKEHDTIEAGNYSFQCIETPGHSPGHICLYEPERRIFVSGDHLLGDITPNIALWSDDVNPLKDYLASLKKIQNLDVEVVLPGHGATFRNFGARIKEINNHHQKRADEVICIMRKGTQNAFDIASQMTWDFHEPWDRFPASQKWFACGEALAHLKYLEEEGKIETRIQEQKIVFSLK